MTSALYIAQSHEGGPFKLGRTSQNVTTRIRQLGGQTLLRYQLVRQFPTEHPAAAEGLAFAWLASRGVQRVGGPKDEHIQAPLALVVKACEEGIAAAQRMPDYAAVRVLTAGVPCAFRGRWPKGALWDALENYPLMFEGKKSSLKELARIAVKNEKARIRLQKLGVELAAYRGNSAEFRVEWSEAAPLKAWVLASLPRPPKCWPSTLTLRQLSRTCA